MVLKEYRAKRDFTKTAEPKGAQSAANVRKHVFVVQKHAARRLHYDLRLEIGGVLKSWAVPKGPSMSVKDKRLAVMTEDHPLEYGTFEGVIPAGEYGAGNVEIWDKGFFVNITVKDGKVQAPESALKKGHILVWLKGDRLRGGFALTRTNDKNWILVKMKDEEADNNRREVNEPSTSVTVNRRRIEITHPNKEVFANITKMDVVEYYRKAAPLMLEHVRDRPISMYRFPHGMREEGFFQKHVPDYFPSWIHRKKVVHKGSAITYVMANDAPSIVYLATQMVIPHIGPARTDRLNYPDRMIFDLDPSVNDLDKTQQVARNVKRFLDTLQMPSYIMTTGSKGYHIVVPLDRSTNQTQVKAFATSIAGVLADHYDDTMTNEMRKEKRGDRVMIDIFRNSPTHTAVAPYAVRQTLRGGIAMPIHWKDVRKIGPHDITLDNVYRRLRTDVWKGMYRNAVSVRQVRERLQE